MMTGIGENSFFNSPPMTDSESEGQQHLSLPVTQVVQ